nr:PREDICTED: WAS/WASL-interacting protein family member 3-like [Balearica regulorum gibbericeps]
MPGCSRTAWYNPANHRPRHPHRPPAPPPPQLPAPPASQVLSPALVLDSPPLRRSRGGSPRYKLQRSQGTGKPTPPPSPRTTLAAPSHSHRRQTPQPGFSWPDHPT